MSPAARSKGGGGKGERGVLPAARSKGGGGRGERGVLPAARSKGGGGRGERECRQQQDQIASAVHTGDFW